MAKRIGELLVDAKVITPAQLESALSVRRTEGRKLGQLLIELELVTETQLTQALSHQLSVPWVSLHHVDFSRSLLNTLPRAVAERWCMIPIFIRKVRKQGETLYVAMDDPTNEAALLEVAKSAGIPVRPMIACPSDIRAAIRVYYGEPEGAASSKPVEPEPPTRPAQPAAVAAAAAHAPPKPPPPPPPPPADSPSAGPEIETVKIEEKTLKGGPRMLAITLLDGTSIQLPAAKRKGTAGRAGSPELSEELTARDLISALRAVTQGADASEILGDNPRWEAIIAALLSVLLRKGLVADWEFVEELRKI